MGWKKTRYRLYRHALLQIDRAGLRLVDLKVSEHDDTFRLIVMRGLGVLWVTQARDGLSCRSMSQCGNLEL